jgi:hypothetical protein
MNKPKVAFPETRVMHLAEHRFFHGSAAVEGRVVLFFYFEEANTGLMALVPGLRGGMELGRFRIPAGIANPERN